jgi:hypothetical protein
LLSSSFSVRQQRILRLPCLRARKGQFHKEAPRVAAWRWGSPLSGHERAQISSPSTHFNVVALRHGTHLPNLLPAHPALIAHKVAAAGGLQNVLLALACHGEAQVSGQSALSHRGPVSYRRSKDIYHQRTETCIWSKSTKSWGFTKVYKSQRYTATLIGLASSKSKAARGCREFSFRWSRLTRDIRQERDVFDARTQSTPNLGPYRHLNIPGRLVHFACMNQLLFTFSSCGGSVAARQICAALDQRYVGCVILASCCGDYRSKHSPILVFAILALQDLMRDHAFVCFSVAFIPLLCTINREREGIPDSLCPAEGTLRVQAIWSQCSIARTCHCGRWRYLAARSFDIWLFARVRLQNSDWWMR